MSWYKKTSETIGKDFIKAYRANIENTIKEVKFILSVTKLKPPSEILDLCCGIGRHSIEFAKDGYKVTGLDISSAFLEIAKEKALSKKVNIKWICDDMRNIPFENKFDLVISIFGSWGYFEYEEENFEVFQKVSNSLKKNGLFFFDFLNHDWIIKHFQPFGWRQEENFLFLEKREYDILSGTHTSYVTTYNLKSLEKKEWIVKVRGYTFSQIKEMLQRANLDIISVYGDYDGRIFSLETPKMLILAQKK